MGRSWPYLLSAALHGVAALGMVRWTGPGKLHAALPTSVTLRSATGAAPPPPPAGGTPTSVSLPRTPRASGIPKHAQRVERKDVAVDVAVDTDGEAPAAGNGLPGGQLGGTTPGGQLGGTPGGSPAPSRPRPKNVPPHHLDNDAIFHPEPHLPEVIKAQRRGTEPPVFGARLCVDESGSVFQLQVIQSIPGADEAIVATLRQWRYRPQPIPVCFVANFQFDIE